MAHWKASHHIEGVPHVDGAQCSEGLAEAWEKAEALYTGRKKHPSITVALAEKNGEPVVHTAVD